MQKKKQYKALVVDFDNTLVGRDFRLSRRLKRAIERIINAGVVFSIATGRPYFGIVREVCRELGLVCPQIAYGGAEIYDPRTDEVLWGEYLSAQRTRRVIEFFKTRKLFFVVQKKDVVYAEDCRKLRQSKFKMPRLKLKELRELEMEDDAVPKIIVVAGVARLAKREADRTVGELNDKFDDLHVVKIRSYEGNYGVDITSAKASKHIAVLELLKIVGVGPEDVVGVGDGYNDYPLLTACGMKVAMRDGPQELKDIADFIAPPREEDGLAKAIEKFF